MAQNAWMTFNRTRPQPEPERESAGGCDCMVCTTRPATGIYRDGGFFLRACGAPVCVTGYEYVGGTGVLKEFQSRLRAMQMERARVSGKVADR